MLCSRERIQHKRLIRVMKHTKPGNRSSSLPSIPGLHIFLALYAKPLVKSFLYLSRKKPEKGIHWLTQIHLWNTSPSTWLSSARLIGLLAWPVSPIGNTADMTPLKLLITVDHLSNNAGCNEIIITIVSSCYCCCCGGNSGGTSMISFNTYSSTSFVWLPMKFGQE